MPTIRTAQLQALQKAANRQTSDGREILANFDATYTDRDGRTYPAHLQHLDPVTAGRESEPVFRVWVDRADNEVAFKVSQLESGRESEHYWKLSYDADGTQRQEKISAEDLEEVIRGCTEYKCLLFTPKMTPHALSADSAEPYAKSIKIPVVDLLVDFGDAIRGVKLNHVGNVRPSRHAGVRLGETRMPYYTECEFRVKP